MKKGRPTLDGIINIPNYRKTQRKTYKLEKAFDYVDRQIIEYYEITGIPKTLNKS